MKFNIKLKILRNQFNLTQEEMAERLDVSRQAITKWESGEGMPDIDNLKQIAALFETTIDDLVADEKEVEPRAPEMFKKELAIDHSKHYDIHVGKAGEINLCATTEEKVRVEVSSLNTKVKFDDHYNRLDIFVKCKDSDATINIYVPKKYVDEFEIAAKIKNLNVRGFEFEKLEFDGALKNLNVEDTKGKIVLNASKSDIDIKYDRFEGGLEINSIHSTARVALPYGAEYKAVVKGIKNQFVDAESDEKSENYIEINGLGSKVIMLK